MSSSASRLHASGESPKPAARLKRTAEYADLLWKKWPRAEDWPGSLTIYEAAAYKRVEYKTIWRACKPGRDGKARLSHQRFGTDYRISKAALDRFGLVEQREAA
jgi:hypothetical protein